MSEERLRSELVEVARSLHARGYTHGSTGNVSARIGERTLVSPTGVTLGALEPEQLSLIGPDGSHLDGPPPTKEAFLHAAMLRARPQDRAAVHTHSVHAAAVSALENLDGRDVLPRLTAYYGMRIQRLPLLPFHAPGDRALEALAEHEALTTNALLLRNHGPIVSGSGPAAAGDALEELEQTARIFLLTRGLELAIAPVR